MLLREPKIRLFSYFLRSLILKPIIVCFSLYEESIRRFSFSVRLPCISLLTAKANERETLHGPGRGVGVIGLIFAGYVPLASQSPYLIIIYSVRQICYFRDPNLVTFYFYELNHFLNGMKNTLSFTAGTNILVRLLTENMKNCFTQKIRKCATPF